MSRDERCHANNGIWLCQTCGKLIDSDESRYSLDVLRTWKAAAESKADQRLNAGSRNRNSTVAARLGLLPAVAQLRLRFKVPLIVIVLVGVWWILPPLSTPTARIFPNESDPEMRRATIRMPNELRRWEDLETDAEREELLEFTDRFARVPQLFVSGSVSEPLDGMTFDLEVRKGNAARELIVRDVVFEVVAFHSLAPTFMPGATLMPKPVLTVELESRASPLPWRFTGKSIASSEHAPRQSFVGTRVSISTDEWNTFLVKLTAKDRGVYMLNIDVTVQEDNNPPSTLRVTSNPIAIAFFESPDQNHRDYDFLHQRYRSRGGVLQRFEQEP